MGRVYGVEDQGDADESRRSGGGQVTVGIGGGGAAVGGYLDGLIGARVGGAVGRDVPLVSLGFDSLAAIELWARLRTDLGVEVPAGELLELTLEGLTARVRAEGGVVGEGSVPGPAAEVPGAGAAAAADLDDDSPEAAARLLAALDGLDAAGMERLVAGLGSGAETTPGD